MYPQPRREFAPSALVWTIVLVCTAGVAVACLATGAVAATGTGADLAGTATGSENVTLSPAATANGDEYASVEDGELALAFERVNRDARTHADRVFVVESNLEDQALDVRVTADLDDVSFYWRDDPTAAATDPHRLEPGTTVEVGVVVDSDDGLEAGTHDFTVIAEEASEEEDEEDEEEQEDGREERRDRWQLTIEELPERHLSLEAGGEPLRFSVWIENPHGVAVHEELALTLGGDTVDRRTVRLEPGERRELTFELQGLRTGTHDLALGGHHVGTVTVRESGVAVRDARVEPAVVERGEPVTVTATVANDGDETRTVTVPLRIGDAIVDETAVRVEPGTTETVTFEWRFQRKGGYEVGVADQSAGSVRVESASVASAYRFTGEHRGALGALTVPLLGGATVAGRRWLLQPRSVGV